MITLMHYLNCCRPILSGQKTHFIIANVRPVSASIFIRPYISKCPSISLYPSICPSLSNYLSLSICLSLYSMCLSVQPTQLLIYSLNQYNSTECTVSSVSCLILLLLRRINCLPRNGSTPPDGSTRRLCDWPKHRR